MKKHRLFIAIVLMLLMTVSLSFGEIGLQQVAGNVNVKRAKSGKIEQIAGKTSIAINDVITTGPAGSALVCFGGQCPDSKEGLRAMTYVSVGPKSRLVVTRNLVSDVQKQMKERTIVALAGSAVFRVNGGMPSSNMRDNCIKSDTCRFAVVTPNAVAGVRGTEFDVSYFENGNITIVGVIEGQVDVANAGNLDAFLRLNKGEYAYIKNLDIPIIKQPDTPVPPVPYNPQDVRPQSQLPVLPALPQVAAQAPAPALAVNFTTTPSVLTGASVANFVFAANDPGATLEYQLDGGAWTASPGGNPSFVGLAEGAHTLNIRATDAGGASVTNSYTWTTDYTAPTSVLAAYPAAVTNAVNGTYTYSTSDLHPGIAQYRVNGGAWTAFNAANPLTLALAEGVTTVDFQAIDAVGNASAVVSYQLFKGLNGYFLDTLSQGNNGNMNGAAATPGNLNAVTGYTDAGYIQNAIGPYIGGNGLPTKVTLYGGVRHNPAGTQAGYFISYATIGGTPSAFTGTTTFKAFADNYLFTGTGSLAGTTSGGTFSLTDQKLGGVTVTPLQYKGGVNYTSATKGQVSGYLGSTLDFIANPFAPIPLQFLGLHTFLTQNPAVDMRVDNILTHGGSTTITGFMGGAAGQQAAGDNEKPWSGTYYGIWVRNDLSTAGIMAAPSMTGTAYGQSGVIDATGNASFSAMSIAPVASTVTVDTPSAGAITAVSGDIIGPTGGGVNDMIFTRLPGENWGVTHGELSGTYSTAVTAGNVSNQLGSNPNFTTDTDIHVRSVNAASRTFAADVYGYTTPAAGPGVAPEVSIIAGKGNGTFDPGATTWQLAFGAVNMEASRFNSMYNDTVAGGGRARLAAMGVPVAEVGFVPSLTYGPSANLNQITSITMNNVTFLAPASGQKPVIWSALGGISGTYDGTGAGSVGVGYGLSGVSTAGQLFSIEFWPTTFTPGSKWIANLTNGTGTVMLPGATPITWRGSAAGATIGGGVFSGQAVGVVR